MLGESDDSDIIALLEDPLIALTLRTTIKDISINDCSGDIRSTDNPGWVSFALILLRIQAIDEEVRGFFDVFESDVCQIERLEG